MKVRLALDGGEPVRKISLPYGRQWIGEDDIEAVNKVLRSDWLTTGPNIGEFEEAFAKETGAAEAIAVSNGTAALHAAMHALDISSGDEVIVTAMTFVASSNCVIYQGGTPVFADVFPDTLLIDPGSVEAKISPRTKAIVAVDYAGQPCDYDSLHGIAHQHGLALVDDAAHSLGGSYKGRSVGTLADLNTFSLHPVKHITTGEGGVITTDDRELAQKMRVFRNHGITTDHRQRSEQGSWFYEMMDLGYNYRVTDFQCALGLSQLGRLGQWVARRQQIADMYDEMFGKLTAILPLTVQPDVAHAYHLYVVRFELDQLQVDRNKLFQALRAEGIGINVHYIPVYLHPYYQTHFGTKRGLCPVAEAAYETIVSLPIFPQMSDEDVMDVFTAVSKVIAAYQK